MIDLPITILIVVSAILVWSLIGFYVVVWIDEKMGGTRMMDWIDRAPYGLSFVMLLFFPVYIAIWIKREREGK